MAAMGNGNNNSQQTQSVCDRQWLSVSSKEQISFGEVYLWCQRASAKMRVQKFVQKLSYSVRVANGRSMRPSSVSLSRRWRAPDSPYKPPNRMHILGSVASSAAAHAAGDTYSVFIQLSEAMGDSRQTKPKNRTSSDERKSGTIRMRMNAQMNGQHLDNENECTNK